MGDNDPLTPRQRQVFTLRAKRWPDADIAAKLGIGIGTVRFHAAAIRRKLGLCDREPWPAHAETSLPRNRTIA